MRQNKKLFPSKVEILKGKFCGKKISVCMEFYLPQFLCPILAVFSHVTRCLEVTLVIGVPLPP